MTAEDLRAIITPAVEANLLAAGLWPTRLFGTINASLGNNGGEWCWWGLEHVHPDDARAQIERRLLDWLDRNQNHYTISNFNGGTSIHSACMGSDGMRLGTGKTRFHALLAAFAGRTSPTGEKEGA